MSKMKHLLRKLHIGGSGGGFIDHHHPPVINNHPPPQTETAPLHQSSTSSTSSSPSALVRTSGAVDSAAENSNSADFNFFEEEFQIQLALTISVSDPDAREDSETAQIKAAKQISLGCSPSETLVEFPSLRYWSYNVVNYDEKVMNGFYDVYGITSNLAGPRKMPSLVDLEATTVSDNIDYEVIFVNRMLDLELRQLEERVYIMSMEWRILETGLITSGSIQKIADLVVNRMGGPVIDAEEMLKRWTARSYELRNSLNTIILPLGCLDVGLSRHRALLFKVLADRIDLPCMLVKGSYYTGTDDGAVNLIKVDNGSEYIIDLMGAPGALIPAEVPSSHLQNSGLDMRSITAIADAVQDSCSVADKRIETVAVSPDLSGIAKDGSSISEASLVGIQSKRDDRSIVERNLTEMFEFGKLLPPFDRLHEGSPGTGKEVSAAQKMKVNDVSEYVISASKNPAFAQKLHAVLLESRASPPSDLFPEMNPNDLREDKALEKIQYYSEISLANHEMSLIPFTVGHQVFSNVHLDHKQKHSAEELTVKQQGLESNVINPGYTLPSDTTSEGFVLVSSGPREMIQADDVAICNLFVDPTEMVARASGGEQTHESCMPAAANPFKGQPKIVLAAHDKIYVDDKIGKVLNNIEKDKGSASKMMRTYNSVQLTVCTDDEMMYPVLDEVAEWEIPWEDLQIGERIGIGSYGEVYRAEWNGTEVAVKKFMNQDISGDALAQFKCEVEIMLRLRHPNVVLFMGAVTRPPNLSILTEFLPRGSLFKLLHRPNTQIDEKRRLRMALDAKGMNYLHTSHPVIVHRDLKTPNLLVDKNWVVKVCDFGMSRMKHHTFLSSKSTAGTAEWMAPEVLRNEPSNEKSDVYSFGVILWELATLQVPWTGMNSMQVVGAVAFQNRHLNIPADIDPMVAEIINDCWNRNLHARPSFRQIIMRLRCLQRLRRETCTNQE